jgi:TolA-binding protein
MKKSPGDRVSRLRDRPPGGPDLADRAAALIRGAEAGHEPSELQMARIEQGIWARSSHRTRPSLVLRMALAVLCLVAGVATVKAYELARRAGWLDRIYGAGLPPSEPARSQPSKRPVRAVATAPSRPVSPVAQEPVALLGPAPEAKTVSSEPPRRQARTSRHVALAEIPAYASAPTTEKREQLGSASMPPPADRNPEGPSPSVASTAPSEEIHALDQAIGLLRRDHNAKAALAALDTYLGHYPHGVLYHEARLARLDALLLLQRTDEALAALETLPLDSGRRSTELQVVRAELRARTNCARAEEDYSASLTHSPDAGLLERILYGRGACRTKLGNESGAAEDLRRYLERFPNGAHARWARQWLETINNSSVKGG